MPPVIFNRSPILQLQAFRRRKAFQRLAHGFLVLYAIEHWIDQRGRLAGIEIEQLPSDALAGAYLEVQERRFDRNGIRQLYDSDAYPFPRRKVTS